MLQGCPGWGELGWGVRPWARGSCRGTPVLLVGVGHAAQSGMGLVGSTGGMLYENRTFFASKCSWGSMSAPKIPLGGSCRALGAHPGVTVPVSRPSRPTTELFVDAAGLASGGVNTDEQPSSTPVNILYRTPRKDTPI